MAPPMGDASGPMSLLMPEVNNAGHLFVHPSDFRIESLHEAIVRCAAPHHETKETLCYEDGYVYDPSAPIPHDSTDVVLVRHGETYWNHDHRLQGQLDTELNATGRAQAQAVAGRFATGEFPFSAIYASDLRRAADTAQAIANKSGFPAITRDIALRERHIGHLQGCLAHEAPVKQPEAHRAFTSTNPDIPIPGGGESMAALTRRTSGAINRIASSHRGERVVVVCHGAVMMALHHHALGRDSSMGVINASVNVVRVSADGRWQVLHWGDVRHLGDMEYDHDGFGGGKDSA